LLTGLVVLLVLVAASCGDDSDDAAPGDDGGDGGGEGVSAEDLDGRSFTSSAVEGHTLVEGTTVSLTFEEGRVGANAGCNTMSGSYEIVDGALVVAEMLQTMMACSDDLAAQDDWLSTFLRSSPEIALVGGSLTLTGDDSSMELTEAASDSIEGRTWAITSLEVPDTDLTAPEGASLSFADDAISVATGCNQAFGEATVGDGTITIGVLGSTRMACEDALMEWEAAVLAFLEGELAYELDGDDLVLTKDDATMTLSEIPAEE
jgi:heat shock protein HslJ